MGCDGFVINPNKPVDDGGTQLTCHKCGEDVDLFNPIDEHEDCVTENGELMIDWEDDEPDSMNIRCR